MPQRRPLRLPQYDYASVGAYFVTICAHERRHIFGEIVDGEMQLNVFGKMVEDIWKNIPSIRHEVELDEWVIMPNHFHAIVFLVGAHGYAPSGMSTDSSSDTPSDRIPSDVPCSTARAHIHAPLRRPRSLSTLMSGFKSVATARINTLRQTPGILIWQRNYYEHVIRDDADLVRIRRYILENPIKWEFDEENR